MPPLLPLIMLLIMLPVHAAAQTPETRLNEEKADLPSNHQQKALLWNQSVGSPPDPSAILMQAGQIIKKPDISPTLDTSLARPLSLGELITLVTSNNPHIQGQKTQWDIQQTETDKARAIFEPALVASVNLVDRSQKNTVEEAASRQFASSYSQRNWDYNAAVEGLLPTGAQVSLGYNYRRLSNTLIHDLTDKDLEYQMFLGATLSQPLLKNAGISVTKTSIHLAEVDAEVAFQDYRREMMRTLADTSSTYWNLFLAQQKLKLREDSLRVAERILADSLERFRTGKMAETDVLESRVAVATRRSQQSEALQELIEATNRLRTFMAVASNIDLPPISACEEPARQVQQLDYDTMLRQALQLRPEYLAAQQRVTRSGIRLAYTKNQLWPELDLTMSYGLNGLDFNNSEAWQQIEDREHKDWSIGLDLRVPLQGNRDGQAEVSKSQLEQKRALLDLKAAEVEVANGIDTSLHYVVNTYEQFGHANQVAEMYKQLLDAEMARLDAGKSNSRTVLEKEEDYRRAEEVALKNLVSLQKALLGLDIAGGTLLLHHGVELMEVEL